MGVNNITTMIKFFITYWYEVLLFLMAAVPSIIIFSIKGRISHWFKKDLEEQKSELARTTNKLQDELRIEYGSLYHKRVNAIEELYSTLLEIGSMKGILDGLYLYHVPSMTEYYYEDYSSNTRKLFKQINYFSQLVMKSRIYFSKTDIVVITSLADSLKHVLQTSDYDNIVSQSFFPPDLHTYMENKGLILIYSEGNKKLILEVEDLFRERIGLKINE